MAINWDKSLFNATCFILPADTRTLHNASSCLAIIPKELDTPKLKEIRDFFDKSNIRPVNPIGLYSLKPEYKTYRVLLRNTKDTIDRAIDEIYFSMSEATYNVAEQCNQRVVTEKKQSTPYSYTLEPKGVEDMGAEICDTNISLLKRARDVSEDLLEERDKIDTQKVRDIMIDKWRNTYAWDLDKNELSDEEIYEMIR